MSLTSYYGLPQIIWSDLCNRLEEIFYDEEIGQMILGVYPSGPRIFGLEQEDPSLYCLYLEPTEDIFNPLKPKAPRRRYFGHDNSYVDFINLWQWVESFNKPLEDIWQLIPCFQNSFFEETEISTIIGEAYNLLINIDIRWSKREDRNLEARAIYLFNQTKLFAPNINPTWGEVLQLNSGTDYFDKADRQIVSVLLKNEHQKIDLVETYFLFLETKISEHSLKTETVGEERIRKEYLKKLGDATSRFYRSII
jgi:hypothetical protein